MNEASHRQEAHDATGDERETDAPHEQQDPAAHRCLPEPLPFGIRRSQPLCLPDPARPLNDRTPGCKGTQEAAYLREGAVDGAGWELPHIGAIRELIVEEQDNWRDNPEDGNREGEDRLEKVEHRAMSLSAGWLWPETGCLCRMLDAECLMPSSGSRTYVFYKNPSEPGIIRHEMAAVARR